MELAGAVLWQFLDPVLVERQMGGESSFQQHHSHGWDGVEAEAASGVDLSCQVTREEQEAVEDPRRHDERREP